MKTNPIGVNHKRKLHKINIVSLSVLGWIEEKALSKLLEQYGSNKHLVSLSLLIVKELLIEYSR
jgi:hypothetical protein